MRRILNLLVILLLVGCATPPSTQILTPLDSGQQITMAVGQVLVIELPSNHTTGYAWMEHTSVSVLKREGKPLYQEGESAPTRVGAGGTEIWRFHAVKVGRQILQLEYVRPWDKNAVPSKVVSYDIAVKPR
jgi:inhibitor of cysteine peptidase